jgi:hypothetical protein
MECILPIWILCGIAGGAMLSRYNQAGTGCLLGFLLGPIGLVIAWTKRDDRKHTETQMLLRAAKQQPQPSDSVPQRNERKCPFCAELILVEAIVCKHCNRDVSGTESSMMSQQPPPRTEVRSPESMYQDPIPPDFASTPPKTDSEFLKFKCSCGAGLTAKTSLSGRKLTCPKCKKPIVIP